MVDPASARRDERRDGRTRFNLLLLRLLLRRRAWLVVGYGSCARLSSNRMEGVEKST
jgi:hypothetical protein